MTVITSNHNAGQLDAAIGSGDTTLSSPGFEFIPAVSSPDLYRIVLDPNGAGLPEVCYVTAHTASATTVTVTRGEEQAKGSSAPRAHALNTEWIHSNTAVDLDDFERQSKLTAKGSMAVAVAPGDTSEFPIGAEGRVFTVDGTAGGNVRWRGGMVELDHQSGTSSSSFLTFANIPTDYRHLLIVGRPMHNNGSAANVNRVIGAQFNADGGNTYNFLRIMDTSTGTTRANNDAVNTMGVGLVGDNFPGELVLWVPNYSLNGTTHRCLASGIAAAVTNNSADWSIFKGAGFYVAGAAAPVTEVRLVVVAGAGDVWSTATELTLYGLG